jgi:hypothetical protein
VPCEGWERRGRRASEGVWRRELVGLSTDNTPVGVYRIHAFPSMYSVWRQGISVDSHGTIEFWCGRCSRCPWGSPAGGRFRREGGVAALSGRLSLLFLRCYSDACDDFDSASKSPERTYVLYASNSFRVRRGGCSRPRAFAWSSGTEPHRLRTCRGRSVTLRFRVQLGSPPSPRGRSCPWGNWYIG